MEHMGVVAAKFIAERRASDPAAATPPLLVSVVKITPQHTAMKHDMVKFSAKPRADREHPVLGKKPLATLAPSISL